MKQLLLFLLLFSPLHGVETENFSEQEQLPKAHELYLSAANAKTIDQKQKLLNQALAIYLHFDTPESQRYGNGKLSDAIGSIYYELESYPYAALYFYRAYKLQPRNEEMLQHLQMTLDKLGVTAKPKTSLIPFSESERFQIFFAFTLCLIAGVSVLIWTNRSAAFKKGLRFFFVICLAFLANLLYMRLTAPIEAVMLQTGLLKRGSGEAYELVSDKPVLAGTKVTILNHPDTGEWVQILTPEQGSGYVPLKQLGLIETTKKSF